MATSGKFFTVVFFGKYSGYKNGAYYKKYGWKCLLFPHICADFFTGLQIFKMLDLSVSFLWHFVVISESRNFHILMFQNCMTKIRSWEGHLELLTIAISFT